MSIRDRIKRDVKIAQYRQGKRLTFAEIGRLVRLSASQCARRFRIMERAYGPA